MKIISHIDAPEPAVSGGDSGTATGAGVRGELLPERQVLDDEVGVREGGCAQATEEQREYVQHRVTVGGDGGSVNDFPWYEC